MLTKAQAENLGSRRRQLAGQIKKMAATLQAESREFTADESKEFERLNAEYDDVSLQIGREQEERNEEGNAIMAGAFSRTNRVALPQATALDLAVAGWLRAGYGIPVPAEEFDAARSLGFDPRSNTIEISLGAHRPTLGRCLSFSAAGQLTVPGPSGGYTIPEGMQQSLEYALKMYSTMLQVSEVMITADGREMPWPTIDDTSSEGVQLAEAGAASETSLTFGAVIFRSYKFTSQMLKCSHELLRDTAANLATELGRVIGERCGRILNRRCTSGTGAATIRGVVGACSTGVTAASATAITFDEIIRLQHSVDPAYRVGGTIGWMMHSDVAGAVRRLKDGNGQYIWQNNTQAGQPPLLLGDPVYFNQHMDSTIATGNTTVLYGKLDQYKIRLVEKLRLLRLVERYAENDQVGFIGFLSADGNLLLPSSDTSLCPIRKLVQP